MQEPSGVAARPSGVRSRLLALAVLLGLLAAAPYPQAPAVASCAGPTLEVEDAPAVPVVVRRGEQVTVTGRGFVDGCDDTGGGSAFGCSGDDEREIESPLADIELVLLQGQPTMTQTSLGVADAGSAEDGELGQVTWTFTVPEQQPLGPAVLKTEGSEPLRIRVVG